MREHKQHRNTKKLENKFGTASPMKITSTLPSNLLHLLASGSQDPCQGMLSEKSLVLPERLFESLKQHRQREHLGKQLNIMCYLIKAYILIQRDNYVWLSK